MKNPNKSAEGNLIFFIYGRPFHQGASRKNLEQKFVQEMKYFKSGAELKVKLKNLIKQNLISKSILNKEACYMISDKTIGYLSDNGYLDLAETRNMRLNELLKKKIDFNAKGKVVLSRKNYDTYLKIQQTLYKEFFDEFLPLNMMEKIIRKTYFDTNPEEVESDIDLLVFKGLNGEI